jgi:hypothetical protein
LEKAFLQVRSVDMPPPKKKKMSISERQELLRLLAGQHSHVHKAENRRLTKVEFVNSLSDLLDIEIQPSHVASLPDDISLKEFNTIGNMGYSETHLRLYLDVIDQMVELAFLNTRPQSHKYISSKFIYEKHPRRPKIEINLPVTALKSQTRAANGLAFPYFRDEFECKESGYYEIIFTASSMKGATALVYAGDYYQDGALVNKEPRLLKALAVSEKKTFKINCYLIAGEQLAFSTLPKNVLNISNPVIVNGPITAHWPPERLKALLPNVKLAVDQYTLRVVWSKPYSDFERCIQNFANRAFRQEVDRKTLKPFFELGERYLKQGDFLLAVKETFKALLSSPSFLYLNQADDYKHTQASKVSYFLWRSTPDKTMLEAAYSDKLEDDLDRIISSPKVGRFLEDFTKQWLGLKSITKVSPDYRLYPEYDGFLSDSLMKESIGFINYLFREDKPLDSLIDSDFIYINNRLAILYGIPGVIGPEFRIVKKPKDSRRGGLLTQAAVMVATADGASTTPVKRGVWLSERILGKRIPLPPKNIAGIEADLNGKMTIIEKLNAHRNSKSCRSCHTRIDPYGVAFENFDPIGQYRQHYRVLPLKARKVITLDNKRVFKNGPLVDSAYTMSDGRKYKNISELKRILMTDKGVIHRAFVQKIYMFVLGRELMPTEVLDSDRFSRKHLNTGLKSLLKKIILSKLFRGQS